MPHRHFEQLFPRLPFKIDLVPGGGGGGGGQFLKFCRAGAPHIWLSLHAALVEEAVASVGVMSNPHLQNYATVSIRISLSK